MIIKLSCFNPPQNKDQVNWRTAGPRRHSTNTRRSRPAALHCLILTTIAAACLTAPVLAADWQAGGAGPRRVVKPAYRSKPGGASEIRWFEDEICAGGLALELYFQTSEGFPVLRKHTRPEKKRLTTSSTTTPQNKPRFEDTIDFGRVAPADNAGFFVDDEDGDWSFHRVMYRRENAGKETFFEIAWNRLTPAVLIRTDAPAVNLFDESGYMPRHYIAGPGARENRQPDEFLTSDSIQFGDQDWGWLLVWAGSQFQIKTSDASVSSCKDFDYAADCPFLILFQRVPDKIEYSEKTGLSFAFDPALDFEVKGAGAICLMPLYGEKLIPRAETSAWEQKGAPKQAIERCEKWARALGNYPLSVKRSFEYDKAAGAVVVNEKFEFVPVLPDAGMFAPVPPMVALAKQGGMPVGFSKEPEDLDYITAFGPYQVVRDCDGYSWTLTGLPELLDFSPRAAAAGNPPETLQEEFETMLSGMIEAGALAPWVFMQSASNCGPEKTKREPAFSAPGERLYLLCEFLPLVRDAGLRTALADYIKRERKEYPPEEPGIIPFEKGARREWHKVSEAFIAEVNEFAGKYNFHLVHGLTPLMNFYGMARYYHAFPDERNELPEAWAKLKPAMAPYLERTDWATGGWVDFEPKNAGPLVGSGWLGMGGAYDANLMLAGCIGYARLAELAGDTDAVALGCGQAAAAACWRIGMDKLLGYFYAHDLLKIPGEPHWQIFMHSFILEQEYPEPAVRKWIMDKPVDDMRRILRMNEFGAEYAYFNQQSGLVAAYRGLVPEAGRLLGKYARAEAESFVAAMAEHAPDWFSTRCEAFGAGGLDPWMFSPPEDHYQLFLARAWALGEKSGDLEKYIDVPFLRVGDLYHIHKLAETIRAGKGE